MSTAQTDKKKAHARKSTILVAFSVKNIPSNLAENSELTYYCQNQFLRLHCYNMHISSTSLRWSGGSSNCTVTLWLIRPSLKLNLDIPSVTTRPCYISQHSILLMLIVLKLGKNKYFNQFYFAVSIRISRCCFAKWTFVANRSNINQPTNRSVLGVPLAIKQCSLNAE